MSDNPSTETVTVAAPTELAYPLADEFARRLHELAPEGELVVDLRAVTFMDSCGLRALLTERGRRQQAGGTIAVTNASQIVRRLFAITGVDTAIPMRG